MVAYIDNGVYIWLNGVHAVVERMPSLKPGESYF